MCECTLSVGRPPKTNWLIKQSKKLLKSRLQDQIGETKSPASLIVVLLADLFVGDVDSDCE